MKKLMVGVDVSKDTLDYCVLHASDHRIISRGIIKNEPNAIKHWFKKLDSSSHMIALEHTGHYGALLAWQLSDHDFDYYMINPYDLKQSMGVQRGKTDAVDAYRIASYSITQNHRLQCFKLPTVALRKLKVLMTARDRFVKISVQHQNSLKANEILGQSLDLKSLIKEEKNQIKRLQSLIKRLDKQMLDLIKANTELDKTYSKLVGITGVGPITSIKCIVETNNFVSFKNARKFSCYCGLAPFPYQSGSSIKGKTRTHHLRNRPLKAILFQAACTAIQHDLQLKRYYSRKIQEGKPKLLVINAVANKLVLRIFAVIKREEPFVKLVA